MEFAVICFGRHSEMSAFNVLEYLREMSGRMRVVQLGDLRIYVSDTSVQWTARFLRAMLFIDGGLFELSADVRGNDSGRRLVVAL